jgi:hypothetical protein
MYVCKVGITSVTMVDKYFNCLGPYDFLKVPYFCRYKDNGVSVRYYHNRFQVECIVTTARACGTPYHSEILLHCDASPLENSSNFVCATQHGRDHFLNECTFGYM